MALPRIEPFDGTGSLPAGWTQANLGGAGLTLQCSSGQGLASAANTSWNCDAYWTGDTFDANQYAKVDIVTGLESGRCYVGLQVRASGTGGSYLAYMFATDGASGTGHTSLHKITAGPTYTEVAAFATTFANGDEMKIEATGTSTTAIRCFKNGVQIGSTYNDSSSPFTSGSAGVGVYNQISNNLRIDNFEGGNAAAPVALRGSAAVPAGNPTTSCTLTVDAAVVAGDLLFLPVTSRDSTGAGTLSVTDNDTGGNTWTKIGNSTDHKATLWYKRATSGTASKTVTVSNAVGSCSAVLKAFSGADTGATPYTNVTVETNASGDETATGITPTNADSMLCCSIHNYNNDNAVTSLASANFGAFTTTEKLSTGGSDCATAFGHDLVTSGATGNVTWAQTDGTTYSILWAIKPAAVGYTLTADPGSVSLTGTAATLKYGREVAADAGAVTIAGTAASLEYGREVAADPGAVALTGTAADLEYGRRLDASAGAVVITGTDADLIYTAPQDYTLVADPGAVTLTGTAAGLLYGREVSAGAGAVDVAGTDAGLYFGREVAADPGAVTVTGTAAGLLYGRELTADPGAVAITGTAADLEYGRKLAAEPGAVTIVGTDADLVYGVGYRLTAEAGAFVITGTAAGLLADRILVAESGSVAVAGTAAGLEYGRALAADSGTVAVTGTAAGMLYGRRLDASAGAVSVTGQDADLRHEIPGQYVLSAAPGAVLVTGQDATLTYTPLEPEPPPSPGAGGLGFNILTRPMRRPRPPLAAGMTPAVAVGAAVRRPAVLEATARGGMSAQADGAESTRPTVLAGTAGGGTVAQGATVTRPAVLPAEADGAGYGSGRTAYELLEAF